MKKFVYGLATLVMGASFSAFAAVNPVPATAVVNPNAAPTRVGVLDMRQVMERSTQIAQIREKLQREFKPKQDKLVALQTTFKNDADRLRRDNAIMNNNDRKQLEQKILTEQQDLQRMQANFQKELVAEQNKVLGVFLENVKSVLAKVAESKNIGLIITKDTVAYERGLDITNDVINQLPHK